MAYKSSTKKSQRQNQESKIEITSFFKEKEKINYEN